jgi:hypothetical protein
VYRCWQRLTTARGGGEVTRICYTSKHTNRTCIGQCGKEDGFNLHWFADVIKSGTMGSAGGGVEAGELQTTMNRQSDLRETAAPGGSCAAEREDGDVEAGSWISTLSRWMEVQ